MGIWEWIKDAYTSARITEKERAYWWVSEAQRKKCRKILDDNWRNANKLTLGWPDWHACMQEEPKPYTEWKIYKDFSFMVRFIKELVGIPTKEEKIEIKEIPPTVIRPPPTAPRPVPEKEKIPKEKIPREKKKKEKIRKPRKIKLIKLKKPRKPRKLADRSHLSFGLFSGALKWRNIIKPDFLLQFENIGDKMLEEISTITGAKK